MMKKIPLIFLLLTVLSGSLVSAEKDNQVPCISFGINGNFGLFDVISRNFDFENKKGFYTGGGISLEKLFSNNTGFGSGIQYRRFKTEYVLEESGTSTGIKYDVSWTLQSINIPFVYIIAFRGDNFGLNLEAGAVYSHITKSTMKVDTSLILDSYTDDALKYIKADQIGLTAGIIFIIKATDYTDFTFGITGEIYPTNLLIERDYFNGKLNMYNYSLTAGYMFRTNVFSGQAE